MATIDIQQSLENLKLERDAIVLYDALAGIEKDERRAGAFRTIASNERRHAEVWAGKLRELGASVPEPDGARLRVRLIIGLARIFGTSSVSDLVQALEGDEEDAYTGQASPEVVAIAADEREHAEIWRRLEGKAAPGAAGGVPAETFREIQAPRPRGEVGRDERWHRTGQSGTLRAVIFGVSDGLVSNTSLVMGVTGASPDPHFILLAGIAGLLAGSFSMAAGEYISMQSQRELYQRQIALERAEMQAMPDEEQAELASIYRAKGFSEDEANRVAARLFRDPEAALDTLIREELGLDPDQLGSPWRAAFGSLLAFAAGAAVPVLPYLVASGAPAFAASLILSLAAMFVVGVGISLLTGRSALFSGARQVFIGALAATVTFIVGRLIGVAAA
ncbi:MAG: VIT1/CCC1 transporter family protein [Candidatus Limnocylindrales bacterium]|jgi:VIT1/CCC1 family predicted Fe2+/Mn2+ transporter